MLDKNINKVELVKIVRSLVAFIVIDSKDYIGDELMEDYIKNYLQVLSKSMNGANDFVNTSNLWKTVENDILLIIKQSNN